MEDKRLPAKLDIVTRKEKRAEENKRRHGWKT